MAVVHIHQPLPQIVRAEAAVHARRHDAVPRRHHARDRVPKVRQCLRGHVRAYVFWVGEKVETGAMVVSWANASSSSSSSSTLSHSRSKRTWMGSRLLERRSQMRSVRSYDAVTTALPSCSYIPMVLASTVHRIDRGVQSHPQPHHVQRTWLNATALIICSWPVNFRTTRPDATSHRKKTLSPPTEAKRALSCVMATSRICSFVREVCLCCVMAL